MYFLSKSPLKYLTLYRHLNTENNKIFWMFILNIPTSYRTSWWQKSWFKLMSTHRFFCCDYSVAILCNLNIFFSRKYFFILDIKKHTRCVFWLYKISYCVLLYTQKPIVHSHCIEKRRIKRLNYSNKVMECMFLFFISRC